MTIATQSVVTDLVAKVRELAAARPDNVYQPVDSGSPDSPQHKCSYLEGLCRDGTVDCLVGQALVAIGFSADQLQPVNKLSIDEALNDLLPELDEAEPDDALSQIRWLMALQCAQDEGNTWRKAIELANEEEPL